MKIFHICNNYTSSKVHEALVLKIADECKNYEQDVYIPTRKNVNIDSSDKNINIFCEYVIKPRFIKFFPLIKIIKVFYNVYSKYKNNILNTDFIIAHTFWSDGAVSYLLSRFFKKKYIVCIRNTDLNIFMKYLFVYKFFMKHIAEEATALIFISNANYHQGIESYSYLNNNKNKTRVIYNGIDDFWLNNINVEKFSLQRSKDLKLLYIGRLDENKNLPGTYVACKMLIDSGIRLNLTIVGGTVDELLNLLNLETLPQWVDYYEFTQNKVDIMNHYRNNDIFIMPSFRETFGLVYVEAISQGCHCICSRGQGIDGVFSDFNVTSFCDPKNIDSIKDAIINASEFDISLDVKKLTSYVNENFSWSNIAGKYISILRDSV